MASPTLTILVPTNDRPEVLDLVWSSWLEQEGLTQIVVVDDGSTVSYGEVFARLSAACDQRRIRLDLVATGARRGAPAARNLGLAACRGHEILTVDDDIVLGPGLVAELRRRRPAGGLAIVGPRVVYLRDDETEARADARAAADHRPYFDAATLTLVPWVKPPDVLRVPFVTAVALWPRALFALGLRYFEGYGGNGYREETDPQVAAQAVHGATVHFVPQATTYHLPPRVAYARPSGQRRGNLLSFEYHVAVNNARFLSRHGTFLTRNFGARPLRCWIALERARLSLGRAFAWIARKRTASAARSARGSGA